MHSRRVIAIVLLALLCISALGACRQSGKPGSAKGGTAASSGTAAPPAGRARRIAIAFDATESDPWASEFINTIGTELGFDPWSKYSQSQHLDIYGPYTGSFKSQPVEVSIALSGLTGVSDLLSQQVLGEEARNWIVGLKPELVWLDGDQAQFMIGRELPADLPIVFSGTVGERDFYYEDSRQVTGVYQRYSLPKVITEIWRDHPEAASLALLSDSSTAGQSQREQFRQQMDLLQPGSINQEPPPAIDSWDTLRQQAHSQKDAEALVICGFQIDSAPAALQAKPCPQDIFKDIEKKIVVLGPSLLDGTGALSLRLVPSEHARGALDLISDIFKGEKPADILPFTPMEMQRFVSKKNGTNLAPDTSKSSESPEKAEGAEEDNTGT